MVSIKDIARALSVSPSSVSLVLTGKAKERRISDGLSDKIIAKAEEMGYQPNRAAVSLRTGKSKTIGLIVENIANHFFSSLAHTIQEEARHFHYNVVYCSTENDAQKGREVLQLLHNQQVDGYIITPTMGMEAEIEKLVKWKKPLVLMDRNLPGLKVPFVMVDNYQGVYEGMDYLIKKGNRKIGFVLVNLNMVHMQEREKAYVDALRKNAIPFEAERLLRLDYSVSKEEAVAHITRYLTKQSDLEAIFFATNYLGIYGLLSMKELGLRIPADIKMLCFDDHDAFELYRPAITVVQQPIQEIARTALALLVAKLGHAKSPRKTQILIPPELLIRSSV
ncbi:MAG TPA: substrate-binding domain-containing protein [Flavisolibacter sp.]|jgi:LacI family transcriptional regulator|nr:substrate-binding domain-containing protein [Flavisolibacter sp.]